MRLKWHNSIVIGQFQSINNVRLLTNHYHHFDVIVNLEEVITALNMKAIFAIKNTTIAVKNKKKKAHMVSKLLTSLIPMQSFTLTELTNITARGTLVLSCFLQPHHVSFCRMADICSKYFDLLEHQVVGEERLSFFSASLGDATRQPRQLIC